MLDLALSVLAPVVSPTAATSDLYLQILAALAGAGGLIPLLIKVVPAVVKWWEARRERQRQIALEPLRQLREDYERQLEEATEREQALRQERDHWQREWAEEMKRHSRTAKLAAIGFEHLLQKRSDPPPSEQS